MSVKRVLRLFRKCVEINFFLRESHLQTFREGRVGSVSIWLYQGECFWAGPLLPDPPLAILCTDNKMAWDIYYS